MLDIKFIRANLELVKEGAVKKHIRVDWDRFSDLEKKRRELIETVENQRQELNEGSSRIPKIKDAGEKTALLASLKNISEKVKELQVDLNSIDEQFNELVLTIPNPPGDDVPLGKDDSQNIEVKKWGELPTFGFTPKSHIELGETLDIIDSPRGVKIAGSRSYFLKGAGALLEMAVIKLAVDVLSKKGYTPFNCPMLVKDVAMIGTGYYPAGKEQAYYIEKDELSLIGTSEVSVASYHYDEILSDDELPKRYMGISSCFRREAGTYGKDTKGLYRVHQFQKVEQVILCHNDVAESDQFHMELLGNAEEIMQLLKIPYRVVKVCAGDLGMGQVRKHDIEAWMPSREGYGETHSCSTFYEYQARRLKTRYKDKDGKTLYVHTLNNTAIASPRVLISILELNQNADGSINIPEVLMPYMGGLTRISAK